MFQGNNYWKYLRIVRIKILMIASLLFTFEVSGQDSNIQLSNFKRTSSILTGSETDESLAPWKIVRLNPSVPATHYQIISWDGVFSIQAVASGSMALFARTIDIDLQRYPVLCWRWRVDAPLLTADMRSKAGDDYAARIYIAFRLPDETMNFSTRIKLKFARSIYGELLPDAALNYVWDNRYPIGTTQANIYTDRTQMIVLQSGKEKAGKWVEERRDILADAIHAFGDHRFTTTLFAVAADTDNTGETARSGFANMHFVERDRTCQF